MSQTITHKNLLPGLINKEVEFFAVSRQDVRCIHNGRVWKFEEFPQWILDTVRRGMGPGDFSLEDIRGFIFENFGGVDCEPDIDTNGRLNHPEYFAQSGRKNLPVRNGKYLTPMQLQILQRINQPYKQIAEALFISPETVKSHIQNTMLATELSNKVELAIFASRKGII